MSNEMGGSNGKPPLDEEGIDSRQTAAFLQLHFKTVERPARKRIIPATRFGKKWQFLRSVLREWRREQMYLNLKKTHTSTKQKQKENEDE